MTDDDEHDVLGERRRLQALAYRMLGTTGEAEDAVQETYARWYRMGDAERAAIANPAGWLTRVAGRVCLDLLGTARARRESYVGEWLPEPLPAGWFLASPAAAADPLDRVAQDEAVSTALLVVLEAMTPPERVAFVLHDVFGMPFAEIATVVDRTPAAVRQLATSARRRIEVARSRSVARSEHDAVVAAFARASRSGDLTALTALLDPEVRLRSDGGGAVSAARRAVAGADRVGRFLLGALGKDPDVVVEPRDTADGAGFALVRAGAVVGIVTLRVEDHRVAEVWIVLNPAKLGPWRAAPGERSRAATVPGR
jgi:RNA polymerase sigma factor (sigma-70 family)